MLNWKLVAKSLGSFAAVSYVVGRCQRARAIPISRQIELLCSNLVQDQANRVFAVDGDGRRFRPAGRERRKGNRGNSRDNDYRVAHAA